MTEMECSIFEFDMEYRVYIMLGREAGVLGWNGNGRRVRVFVTDLVMIDEQSETKVDTTKVNV